MILYSLPSLSDRFSKSERFFARWCLHERPRISDASKNVNRSGGGRISLRTLSSPNDRRQIIKSLVVSIDTSTQTPEEIKKSPGRFERLACRFKTMVDRTSTDTTAGTLANFEMELGGRDLHPCHRCHLFRFRRCLMSINSWIVESRSRSLHVHLATSGS